MAEYRDHYAEIHAAGAEVTGVSVDAPENSEYLRRALKLPFPLLCDTRRELVAAWGVLNEKERGGIATPSVFVVERGLRVRFSSVDRMGARITPAAVAQMLRSGGDAGAILNRRRVIPRPKDWLRVLRNYRGARSSAK